MIYVPTLVDEETRAEVLDKVADAVQDGMRCVEIGPMIGGTVCHLGQRIVALKKNIQIFAIDLWNACNISEASKKFLGVSENYKQAFIDNINKTGVNHLVTMIQNDSIEASKIFEDNSIDFLFLDGCHENPYVTQELKTWLPKMKSNSTIAGHDYCSSSAIVYAVHTILNDDYWLTSNRATYIHNIGNGLICKS